MAASAFFNGSVPAVLDVVVVVRGETGARTPDVCSLFTVSLADLSVADVFAFEIGDLVMVDADAGRGFNVDDDVVVVVVFVVAATLQSQEFYFVKQNRTQWQTQREKKNKPFWSVSTCSGSFCSQSRCCNSSCCC